MSGRQRVQPRIRGIRLRIGSWGSQIRLPRSAGSVSGQPPPLEGRRAGGQAAALFLIVGLFCLSIALAFASPGKPAREWGWGAAPASSAARTACREGRRAIKRGDDAHAIMLLTRAISIEPTSARAYALRGLARLHMARPHQALADLRRAIALDPSAACAYDTRARVYDALHDDSLVYDDYFRALKLDPTRSRTWIHRATWYNDHLHDYKSALQDWDQAVALRPDDPLILDDRATTRGNLQQLADCLADYARSLQIAPDLPLTWMLRGRTWYQMQASRRAIADLDHAIALYPQFARALYWRSLALLDAGQYRDALADATRFITLRPYSPDGYQARSRIDRALGRRDLAAEDVARAQRAKELLSKRVVEPAP